MTGQNFYYGEPCPSGFRSDTLKASVHFWGGFSCVPFVGHVSHPGEMGGTDPRVTCDKGQ